MLRLEEGRLCLFDRTSGERLLTEGEAERAGREDEQRRREAEQQAREAEQQAREVEHQARLAAEAEIERLRRLLEERNANG